MAKSQKDKLATAGLVPAGDFRADAATFAALQGERFSGLNVLKLTAGQSAMNLVITAIGTQTVKGRGKEKNKTRNIPAYSAEAGGKVWKLPLNASLVAKLVEAKVKVGDTIAIARGDEYTSKDGNKGTSYELVVQARK